MSMTSNELNHIKTVVTESNFGRTTRIGLLERDAFTRLDQPELIITRLERVPEKL